MAKNHEINTDKTITVKIWAKSLAELLDDVKKYVESPKASDAFWSITFTPTAGPCSANSEWMAMLTYFPPAKIKI